MTEDNKKLIEISKFTKKHLDGLGDLDVKTRMAIEFIGSSLRNEMKETLAEYRAEVEKNFEQQKKQLRLTFIWQLAILLVVAIGFILKKL